jgi:hypothetical protein
LFYDLSSLNVTITPVEIDPTSTQPTRSINGLLSVIKGRNDVALRWEAKLIKDAKSNETVGTHGSRYPAEASVLGGVAIALVMAGGPLGSPG